MGGLFSKKRGDSSNGSGNGSHSPLQLNSNSPDLSSYEAACRADPDLQNFDSTLRNRTSRVINTLAVHADHRSLSLDSLREFIVCLLDNNQDTVKIILQCREDIWKNKDLGDLVQDYFQNSLLTMDFCNALDKCLTRARDNQLIVKLALKRFEEEQRESVDYDVEKNHFAKTLQELNNFKAAGDPFTEVFFSLFQSVYEQQKSMLKKLKLRRQMLDKKVKSRKSWRMVSNVIFASAFAAVLIFSVVAAAVAAPPVVTAVAAAAAIPMGAVGKWIDTLWTKYENVVKAERDTVGALEMWTCITIEDLNNIWAVVSRLEIEIESQVRNVEFALREEEAVTLAMDEINKKLDEFMKTTDDLADHAAKFNRDITMARTMISRKIIKHLNND